MVMVVPLLGQVVPIAEWPAAVVFVTAGIKALGRLPSWIRPRLVTDVERAFTAENVVASWRMAIVGIAASLSLATLLSPPPIGGGETNARQSAREFVRVDAEKGTYQVNADPAERGELRSR